MKLGILSGTFDPVHEGHLWLARESIRKLKLDEVVLLPERSPRSKKPQASYEDRIQMLEIVTKDEPAIEILKTKESSHSAKFVLKLVNDKYDSPEEIKLIVGADVFDNVSNWDDWEQLKEKVGFIVSLRTEDDGELAVIAAESLGIKIDMLSSKYPHVSSTKIREEIKRSNKIIGVNMDVNEYIRTNKLYGSK